MKRRSISCAMIFFFILALLLILLGILFGVQTFRHFEYLVRIYDDHERLLSSVQATAAYSMIFGGMVVLGIGILVIQFLHLIRRTAVIQKQAETLRKRNETAEELNRKLQQLAHHQRLETIGTLTASIAHEFNNLLTPIMGYSMMALEKLPPEEEELYDDLLEIYNSSQKAKRIISRLNDLSRKNTSDSFREISPDEVIRHTLDVVMPAKPENVELKLDLNCWDQRIRANEIQISQLLLNLILNGFHAMEEAGGILTLSTSFAESDIQMVISDTGCGIAEDVLSRIFEPFFTTKAAGKGTGLGLAIVAQVVEDHQGTIRTKSAVGKGTTFIIRLPRAIAPEQ